MLTTTLPNNYLQKTKPYFYKVPDSLPISFFVNSDPILSSEFTFSNLRLAIKQGDTVINTDAATLSKVDLPDSTYRIYVDGALISGLSDGYAYYFVIYDITDSSVLFRLNCFQFVSDPAPYVQLSYRNSTDIFDYDYEAIPSFRNVIYVDLNQIDAPPEYNLSQYVEVSTGYIRNEKSRLQYGLILEGYFFDGNADDAMKGFSIHDDILINFRPYQVGEGWTREPNIRNLKSKGTIKMYDQELNTINLKG